ncbi:hypothetical protein EOT10_03805 [Streptomyces antnestii]|uniref:Uncharacterized protein n=1 Tax=Streptomyces antnestii TaxID=2494256 RepID=A0A3S2VLX9_9ACTN|nr:hypothetical protein [Streptomyces sp. San01]RVU29171.1 hypothetical protein EOT10_03805 [Streptomyces sp. San01]
MRPIAIRTRAWWRRARTGMAQDAGYSTETVIVTALLVIMTLAVIGVIAAKVTAKVGGIDLG